MKPTNISVIVTVLNEASTIGGLITALREQTRLPDEVIIVDGGSSDGTFEFLEKAAEEATAKEKNSKQPSKGNKGNAKSSVAFTLRVFQRPGNRSVGRNYAIEKANYSWLASTDAGCIPEVSWLEELEKAASEKTSTGQQPQVVAGYYKGHWETPFEAAVIPYVLVMPDKVDPTHFLPATRSMLFHKQAWEQVGGFPEGLSDNEDYVFAKKLEIAKVPMVFAKEAKVSWYPRTNFPEFLWMIFRFARGDFQAGIVRPKVLLVFARYAGWVAGAIWISINSLLFYTYFLVTLLAYCAWAIEKNKRYVPEGWYWLPLLQIGSDFAVMLGSFIGGGRYLWKKL